MYKDFCISFSLKNTYRVNGILYTLKQIPLVKRCLPQSLYANKGLKSFAAVLAVIWEVITMFLWKGIYLALCIWLPLRIYTQGEPAQIFVHLMFFLTIAGAFFNTYMFNPGNDKYYAMVLMKMDGKAYTLSNYTYAIIKLTLGLLPFTLLFGVASQVPLWLCFGLPFFVAAMKISVAALNIQRYKKNGTCTNENFPPKMVWPGAGVLLAMAYGLPYLGITLSGLPMVMLIVLVLALGVFSGIRLTQFTDYRQMYQKLLKEKKGGMTVREMMKATQEEESRKRIVAGGVVSTKKKGFAYFNGLFVQRHRKSLYQSAYKIAGVFSLVFVGAAIALQIFPEVREIVNQQIVTSLPIFLFLMFAINRGMAFTQLLFMNCDHSMLTYSFYKNASNCLTLFRLRLLENIKINLFPAVIIGGGLPLLLYLSGGTAALSSYILLPVCIIAMSVFFSVHHLVCYYLLQPYNVDLEQKSKTYSIVTWVTYMLCYFMMKQKLVIAEFALWVVIFALVYCVVACVLVYKLAPRTFRLRV